MENITLLSRSDDLGSSVSANMAIERVINAGFIRNVSIMACGPAVEDAARRLAQREDVCFGMHITLNAEWDRVKWGPVSGQGVESGLVDEQGYFLADPKMFLITCPAVAAVMEEVEAQYEKLCRLGFTIRYVDSHMFSELFIDGMDDAIRAFAQEKGLRDHMYFYNLPQVPVDYSLGGEAFREVPAGQYFMVTHPSLDTEEMRMTGNAQYPGPAVAAARAAETALLSDPGFCRSMAEAGIRTVRYDEADYESRLTVADVARLLG